MNITSLNETVAVKTVAETDFEGSFEIEGLYTGYGLTIGNALRRVLISSLPGAAITRIKIKGVNHEFSTLEGLTEDIVELTLNLKQVRFRLYSDEPQIVTLKVDVVNKDAHLGRLTAKTAELDMELTVERGLGYMPVEASRAEKLPIGIIALDAIFTPITLVTFVVENMRVGDRTDYNRLKLRIVTDGSITPSYALNAACAILESHYVKISLVEQRAEPKIKAAKAVKPKAVKKE